MLSITEHLKRIRKEAVQNDLITFGWLLYSILLIIFFLAVGYEAIFYLSSSNRLFILKSLFAYIVLYTVRLTVFYNFQQ